MPSPLPYDFSLMYPIHIKLPPGRTHGGSLMGSYLSRPSIPHHLPPCPLLHLPGADGGGRRQFRGVRFGDRGGWAEVGLKRNNQEIGGPGSRRSSGSECPEDGRGAVMVKARVRFLNKDSEYRLSVTSIYRQLQLGLLPSDPLTGVVAIGPIGGTAPRPHICWRSHACYEFLPPLDRKLSLKLL